MNVEVLGRIRPVIRQDSESGISENRIAIEVEGHNRLKNKLTGAGFAFSHLHKSAETNVDVFQTSVEPMMQLFMTGFNCCLLIIGEEGAGKSFTSSGQNGIVHLMMKQLLTKFEEDLEQSQSKSFSNNTRLLSLQMFEVTDDSVKDLLSSALSATSRRLEVTNSAELGPSVSNLSSLQISNSVSGGNAQLRFKQSLANRNRSATSFVCFELSQPMQDTSPPTRSQFSVVVLPAIQPSSAPSSVRVSQFSASEKSMLAFSQLVATLSNKPFADRAINYSACALTKLLEDALGGNCKTTALLCFRPMSDPNIDTSLLHLAEGLAKVKNYPVINNTFLQQLLTQYRSRIISLEALLNPAAIRNVVNNPTGDTTLRDLQAENVLLRDSNERLQHKLEHLKTSFGSLAVSKTDLSAQLLLTEEEKLKISQTLLDMQIENNRLKEEMEAAKFELNNHIIQLEYSKGELARDKAKATQVAQSAQERLGDVEKERRELADDYIKLKSEFMALTKAHHAEIDKNDELSLELMNIVNSKISLMEADQMNLTSNRLRAIADHLSKKPENVSPSKTESDSWQKKPISRESSKRQVEIDKVRKDYEDVKKDYEEIEKELRKKIKEQAQELDNSRKMTRETQKKLAEMNAQVITLKNGKMHFESQVNRLQHKLKESNEEFQMRLITYLKDVAEALKQGDEKEKKSGLSQQVNAMLNNLRKAHRMREDQLSDAAHDFKHQMEQTNRRHEELLVAYKELRQQVKSRGLSGVDLGPDERSLAMTDDELKSRQQQEIDRLQAKLANFGKARLHQDDSASDISDNDCSFDGDSLPTLKKQLREFTLNTQQELEEERAELLSKNAMLEQEAEELHDYINTHLSRYRDEIMRLRQEGATAAAAAAGEKRAVEGGPKGRRRAPPSPPPTPPQAAAQNRRSSVRRP